MRATVYNVARGVYSRAMSAPRSRNPHFGTQVTAREAAVLEAERRRRGERYLSTVLDEALVELLTGRDFVADPLPLPSLRGERLVSKGYHLRPETLGLVRDVMAAHAYEAQQIVRAAIHDLERRTAAAGQGPTQTGW